jgi:hypothetical protein
VQFHDVADPFSVQNEFRCCVNAAVGADQGTNGAPRSKVGVKTILGGDSFIAMVQPPKLRNRYNRSGLHRLNRSYNRGVLGQ